MKQSARTKEVNATVRSAADLVGSVNLEHPELHEFVPGSVIEKIGDLAWQIENGSPIFWFGHLLENSTIGRIEITTAMRCIDRKEFRTAAKSTKRKN
jgi:hypothetical protein